jgi:photosystem II stability/assembly factor-like uncharacterized protein
MEPKREPQDAGSGSEPRQRLLAIAEQGVIRISESDDGWTAAVLRSAPRAQCLAVDPLRHHTLYLGTRSEGLWKSGDGGRRWSRLDAGARDVFAVAVSPADGSVYVGSEPSALFRSRDGGSSWHELEALTKLPSAPTWSFPPRPWTSHVSAIAPHPREAGLLLVGIELGGLMRSEDGGATWQDHRPGAQRDVHALAWHPRGDGCAYQAAGGGAALSRDGGRTWRPADAGRDRRYCWGLAVDELDEDTWYVSASSGPGAAHGGGDADAGIFRWRGDGPWEALGGSVSRPLHDMPYALATSGPRLIAGLRSGRVIVSEDHGETWREVAVSGDDLRGLRVLIPAGGADATTRDHAR